MTQPHLDPTGDEAVFEAYAAESPAADHLPSGRARTVFLTMVRAHAGGVSYKQLQGATGLTRTGVYKALASAVGGSLRGDSTSEGRVD